MHSRVVDHPEIIPSHLIRSSHHLRENLLTPLSVGSGIALRHSVLRSRTCLLRRAPAKRRLSYAGNKLGDGGFFVLPSSASASFLNSLLSRAPPRPFRLNKCWTPNLSPLCVWPSRWVPEFGPKSIPELVFERDSACTGRVRECTHHLISSPHLITSHIILSHHTIPSHHPISERTC